MMLALADAWWRFAAEHYHDVNFIGRADDDVLVNPTFMRSFLEAALRSLGPRSLYAGQFEWYSWDSVGHRPRGWGNGAYNARRAVVRDDPDGRCTVRGHRNRRPEKKLPAEQRSECVAYCRKTWRVDTPEPDKEHSSLRANGGNCNCYHRAFHSSEQCRGPLPFAIGPLHFLSSDLVRRYAESQRIAAAVAGALDSRLDRRRGWPPRDSNLSESAVPLLDFAAARERGRYLPYVEEAPEATHLFEDVFLGHALCAMGNYGVASSSRSLDAPLNLTYVSLPFAPWDVPCNGRDGSWHARWGCMRSLRDRSNWTSSQPDAASTVVHHVRMKHLIPVIDAKFLRRAKFAACMFSCTTDARTVWLGGELPCGSARVWCTTQCS